MFFLDLLKNMMQSTSTYWLPPSGQNKHQPCIISTANKQPACYPSPPSSSEPLSEYYVARVGHELAGKFCVRGRLGGGVHSTTYVVERIASAYVLYSPPIPVSLTTQFREPRELFAAKILSLDATEELVNGKMLEVDIMKVLQGSENTEHLPRLLDTFELLRDEPWLHGRKHVCLIMNLLGSDVASLRRSAPQKALPVHVVKIIIKQVLKALSHLHRLGIVHTGKFK